MTDKEEKKDSVNGDAAAEETKETKTTDWPLKNIADPHAHDVLYGRGGKVSLILSSAVKLRGLGGKQRLKF